MTTEDPRNSPEVKRRIRSVAIVLGLVAVSFFFMSMFLFSR